MAELRRVNANGELDAAAKGAARAELMGKHRRFLASQSSHWVQGAAEPQHRPGSQRARVGVGPAAEAPVAAHPAPGAGGAPPRPRGSGRTSTAPARRRRSPRLVGRRKGAGRKQSHRLPEEFAGEVRAEWDGPAGGPSEGRIRAMWKALDYDVQEKIIVAHRAPRRAPPSQPPPPGGGEGRIAAALQEATANFTNTTFVMEKEYRSVAAAAPAAGYPSVHAVVKLHGSWAGAGVACGLVRPDQLPTGGWKGGKGGMGALEMREGKSCTICKGIAAARPVQLACSHSFCKACLVGHLTAGPRPDEREEKKKKRPDRGEWRPACPICKTPLQSSALLGVQLPPQTTAQFRKKIEEETLDWDPGLPETTEEEKELRNAKIEGWEDRYFDAECGAAQCKCRGVQLRTPGPAKDLEVYAGEPANAIVCPGVRLRDGKVVACLDHKLQERDNGGRFRPLLHEACAVDISPGFPGRPYRVCEECAETVQAVCR